MKVEINDRFDEVVYLMTDQPPTCPKDGRRVVILSGGETASQIVQCPECGFVFRLEEK